MTSFPFSQLAHREEIIAMCRRLDAIGLNQGTSGNISLRVPNNDGGGFLLTPTSMDYSEMEPRDIVHVTTEGGCQGPRRPSSELPFHRAIYAARPDVGAIVHTHSTHATAVACLRRNIPAVHYLVALFGGNDIRCSSYATFGTNDLSTNLMRALEGRRAALMANHGLVVIGDNLTHAFTLTVEAEQLAKLFLTTLATGLEPVLLDDTEMANVAARFAEYGYRPVTSSSSRS